jgi:hypothetical protein
MTVDALASALAALGIRGRVEARERLAVVIASAPECVLDEATRIAALAAARAHGFTHLALELDDSPERASLSRD